MRPEYRPDAAKVELTVYDQTLHEFVTDKLTFPIVAAKTEAPASGTVTASAANTSIYGGADKNAPVVGTAAKGAEFKLTGTAGDFWRVELDGRPGFIAKTAALKGDGAAPAKVAWAQNWQVSPPKLEVKAGAPLVDTPTIHLSSTATDEHKVADMFVFVSNRTAKIDRRKVFYRSNRKSPNQATESFDTEIPLWTGANVVTVVARESTQVQSQQTHRRRAARAARGAADARQAGGAARARQEPGPLAKRRHALSRFSAFKPASHRERAKTPRPAPRALPRWAQTVLATAPLCSIRRLACAAELAQRGQCARSLCARPQKPRAVLASAAAALDDA